MRAHMNSVENLPLFTGLVVAMIATGVRSPVIDGLAIAMLAARIGQTTVHITLRPTNSSAGLRFVLFAFQAACMISRSMQV